LCNRCRQELRRLALAQKARRDGYSALYTRAQSLFRDLAMARADGSLRKLLARVARIDVLVIDDWAVAQRTEPESRDFLEICEDRYQVRSTILPRNCRSRWHEQIGDPMTRSANSAPIRELEWPQLAATTISTR
jgi:DNA replication protein DnaC